METFFCVWTNLGHFKISNFYNLLKIGLFQQKLRSLLVLIGLQNEFD